MIVQVGDTTMKQRAALELFAQIAKEPCFNQLRTIEQLGYIVFSGVHRSQGIESYRVIVQSDKAAPDILDARIEHFLTLLQTDLDTMSMESFQVLFFSNETQFLAFEECGANLFSLCVEISTSSHFSIVGETEKFMGGNFSVLERNDDGAVFFRSGATCRPSH